MLTRSIVLVTGVLLWALCYGLGALQFLSHSYMDLLFSLRGGQPVNQSIVIVAVDAASLDELGPWPFARQRHGELLARLKGARAIGFDFLFSEPTADDAIFASALATSPPVVLAAIHDQSPQNLQLPAAPLQSQATVGIIETLLAGDGVVRQVQLRDQHGVASFALALCEATDCEPMAQNRQGVRTINYHGPSNSFLYLSYHDVLAGRLPPGVFEDRLVLIGVAEPGLGDQHVTPYNEAGTTPGVEIQATIVNNLLDHSFVTALPRVVWLLALALVALSLGVWPTISAKMNFVFVSLCSALLVLCSIILFHQTFFLDISVVLLLLLGLYILHLMLEVAAVTRRLFAALSTLDSQFEQRMDSFYENVPAHLQYAPKPVGKKLRRTLASSASRLEKGMQSLALQQHFVEDLVTGEMVPMALWNSVDSKVTFANELFNRLWSEQITDGDALPDLGCFLAKIQEYQQGNKSSSAPDDLKTMPRVTLDVLLPRGSAKHYYRVNIHGVTVDEAQYSGVVALFTDVSEIKEAERMKDEIVSIVSHELKLPLTTILGYGEMLADSLESDAQLYAEEICTQTRRLNALIEDFLDVNRLERRDQREKMYPLSLLAVLQESVSVVSPAAGKKNIVLELDVPHKVSAMLGDEPLLLQALVNVLDNAIKFSEAKTQITLRLVEEKQAFRLEIADQGPGIAPDMQPTVFDKFSRGGRTGKDGFGLGLSFVQGVIHAHQGTIHIVKSDASGTIFGIRLPKHHGIA